MTLRPDGSVDMKLLKQMLLSDIFWAVLFIVIGNIVCMFYSSFIGFLFLIAGALLVTTVLWPHRSMKPKGAPPRKRYLVLAGNYEQAKSYAFQNDWPHTTWRYVTNEEQLRGTTPAAFAVVVLGDWAKNPDAVRCYKWLRSHPQWHNVPFSYES